jgi:hypothetical protein
MIDIKIFSAKFIRPVHCAAGSSPSKYLLSGKIIRDNARHPDWFAGQKSGGETGLVRRLLSRLPQERVAGDCPRRNHFA